MTEPPLFPFKRALVTGGAGFIGSALVRHLLSDESTITVLNVDKLTYAGNLDSLKPVQDDPRLQFEKIDICDWSALNAAVRNFDPDAIFHLAAESHVDRSIDGPSDFLHTNLVGTYNLVEAARAHWSARRGELSDGVRLLHVSTDEVFGSLGPDGLFTEETPYQPSSPYSATKAGSDHLVRAWHATYGLPVLVTNCSNNFGPYQYPEKLIPLLINKAIDEAPLPIYGTGENVRDWLYVDDHVKALVCVMRRGRIGQTYNVGSNNERTNLDIADRVCAILDNLKPRRSGEAYKNLITFVADRPGHDMRYAIDATKLRDELGWRPAHSFETALSQTVQWYLDNRDWCASSLAGAYGGERLGMAR